MNQHIVKMRNLLTIVLSVVMLTAFAQQPKDADVPEVVQKNFNKKFPGLKMFRGTKLMITTKSIVFSEEEFRMPNLLPKVIGCRPSLTRI